MGRKPGCTNEGLNKGPWTSHEDKLLSDYIAAHGQGRWRLLPKKAGLKRCGKSCRLRWLNYLRPDIKRGNITEEEEDLIIRLHKLLGNRWSLIAGRLPGRTDNEIKNYWNTTLRKKLSGDSSEQWSQRWQNKKPNVRKPSKEKAARAEVEVVRTKAVGCSRLVTTDPLSSFSSASWPNADAEEDFQKDFRPHLNGLEPFPPFEGATNGMFMAMGREEESPLMQMNGGDGFHKRNDGEFSPPSQRNYTRGTSRGCETVGEDSLSLFFDEDVWNSLMF